MYNAVNKKPNGLNFVSCYKLKQKTKKLSESDK